MGTEPTTYRLEPRDGAGLLLGLELVPCLILGIAVLAAAVTAGTSIWIAATIVTCACLVAFARHRGLPLWQRIGLHARWTATRGTRTWNEQVWDDLTTPAGRPACLADLKLVDLPGGGRAAAIANRAQGSLTAVLPVTGGEFLLRDPIDQERLLAAWGDVLSQFATHHAGVAHLSWSDHAHPAGLTDHRHWVALQQRPDAPTPPVQSYAELLSEAPRRAMTHDVHVTVTVDDRHLDTRPGRRANRDRLERALINALGTLHRSLENASLRPHPPLDRHAIHQLLRTRTTPRLDDTGPLGALPRRSRRAGLAPAAMATAWDHLVVDSTVQRSWWIRDWPRHPVGPAWLEPFLSTPGVTRTLTVVLAPIPPEQSRRRIQRDLVKLDSDASTREERGRRVDAGHRRATQAVLDREAQIVAGHPEVAYLGIVTVSACNLDQLEDHSELIEQTARASGLDLQILYARQDLAWAASLPLGLAPRSTLGQ